MNTIWEVAIKAQNENIPFKDVTFVPAKTSSPYLETSFAELNRLDLGEIPVEINTLFRFASIFSPLLDINYHDHYELRHTLFDILLHYLAILDLREGMTKDEFYYLFLKKDIEDKIYGAQHAEVLNTFSIKKRALILSYLLLMYRAEGSIELFKMAVKEIFPYAMVYHYTETTNEILVYIGLSETEVRKRQILFFCDTFLEIDIVKYVYWQKHFGVISIDDTVLIDETIIF